VVIVFLNDEPGFLNSARNSSKHEFFLVISKIYFLKGMDQIAIICEIEREIAHCRWFDEGLGKTFFRNEVLPLRPFIRNTYLDKISFKNTLEKITFYNLSKLSYLFFLFFWIFLFVFAIYEKYYYYYLFDEFKICYEQSFFEKMRQKTIFCYYKAPTLFVSALLVAKEAFTIIMHDLLLAMFQELIKFLYPICSIGFVFLMLKKMFIV